MILLQLERPKYSTAVVYSTKCSCGANVIYRETNHHRDSNRHYGAINVLLSRSEDSLGDLARDIYSATALPDSIRCLSRILKTITIIASY